MGIKSFNEWVLYESNIFQNKYLNDHDVILGTVAKTRKDVMVAWGEAGYAVGDSFTTSANYKGKTSDVVLGSGKYSIIMKDGSGEYIKVKGAMTHINNSLHHKGGATKGPAGQDWENIITHHYNNLINKPNFDKNATKETDEKWVKYDDIGAKVAESFKGKIGNNGGMTQFGKGKATLTKAWKITGAKNTTPKTDMYTDDYNISLKKSGGSQLASGSKAETISTFNGALEHFTADKDAKDVIKEISDSIESNFIKLTTEYSKTDLAKMAKSGETKGNEKTIKDYISTEAFHKKLNSELIPKLNNITDAKGFKEWFIYEAMSGDHKFNEDKAKASVCIEFNVDNGSITKFIPVTKNGKNNFGHGSSISSEVEKIAKKAKIYSAWKSSGKNPYSVLRISNADPYNLQELDDTTLNGIIQKTIREDTMVNLLLKEDIVELDEFKIIDKTIKKMKLIGKNSIKWIKSLLGRILSAIKKGLDKVKEMGVKMFEGLFHFLGVSVVDVTSTIPSEIEGFLDK